MNARRPMPSTSSKPSPLSMRDKKPFVPSRCDELLARVRADVWDAEGEDQVDGVDFAALFDGRQQVRAGLFAKAFELYDLVRVRVQMIEVSKIAQIAAVDELVQRLHGEAVDIKPALARKADKALQVLGGTVRIGAAQRLHAAYRADTHLGRRAADGTGRRDFIAAPRP